MKSTMKNWWQLVACLIAISLSSASCLMAQTPEFSNATEIGTNEFSSRRTPQNQALNQALDQINLSLAPNLRAPVPSPVPESRKSSTQMPTGILFQWEAPNDVYQNLMFEDPLLERHGVSSHERLQPTISGTRFLLQSALLPGKVILRRHKWVDSPLGWGKPSL